MFIFIVTGFGPIGLGTILITTTGGGGIIGTTLITIMAGIIGIDLTDHGIIGITDLGTTLGIMLFGTLVDKITLLILMEEEEVDLSRILL